MRYTVRELTFSKYFLKSKLLNQNLMIIVEANSIRIYKQNKRWKYKMEKQFLMMLQSQQLLTA